MSYTNDWCTADWCHYFWCTPTGIETLFTEFRTVVLGENSLHTQFRTVAYNTNMLRILWEIKSDGIVSNNFSASSEASTDKGVINLKNDIVEKYWQSTGITTEYVQWDAGSGVVISLDTFALIEHNLTSSAVVTLKGYGSQATAAPVSWVAVPVYATFTLSDDPDETNLIWVSPSLPANSFRHWRLEIADTTNPDGYIRIGRLVAGSSLIFNGENCLDLIDYSEESFKDEMKLNGFTTISNNRALKKNMKLSFRNLDTISQTNYRLLKRYLRYNRDTLKALVIVDPRSDATKYRFTTFAKLRQTPTESHRYIDTNTSYSTFELDYDEGR